MRKTFLSFATIIILVILFSTAQGRIREWIQYYGGRRQDTAYAVGYGADGNIYAMGTVRSPDTLIVISYTPAGSLRWIYRAPNLKGLSLACGRDSNLYVGYNGGVISVTPSGAERWRYSWGSRLLSIIYGRDGNIYAAGVIGNDIGVISLTRGGAWRWTYSYNGPGNSADTAYQIIFGDDGNLYVAGLSVGSGTGADFIVISLNTVGEERWVYRYNGPGNGTDYARSIAWGLDGNLYVTGASRGTGTGLDFTVISLTPQGSERWVYRYGGVYDEMALSIICGADTNIYAIGDSTNVFYIVSLTPQRDERWRFRKVFGKAYAVIYGTDGNLYCAGRIDGKPGVVRLNPILGTERWYHPSDSVGIALSMAWGPYNKLYVAGSVRRGLDSSQFTVFKLGTEFRDVGVLSITSPPTVVDSGTFYTPACTLFNYGEKFESTYYVRMTIGYFYDQIITVTNHLPQTKLFATFPASNRWPRGTWTVSCSTRRGTAPDGSNIDMDSTNDKRVSWTIARVFDVGAISILAPTGTIDSNTMVIPKAVIRNFGSDTAYDVKVKMVIDTVAFIYTDTFTVTVLPPGRVDTISFRPWIANKRGLLVSKCSTAFLPDANSGNNWVLGTVTVRVRDVGVTQIISPIGVIDSGTTVTPRAKIKNFGTTTETFSTVFRIGTVYEDAIGVTNLLPGDSIIVSFTPWTATSRGIYPTKCSTRLTGDFVTANDAVRDSVIVDVRDVGVVEIVAPIGEVDSGMVIVPQAKVRNYGIATASFSVSFRIGTFYNQTRNKTLAGGMIDTVNFPAWTVIQRGTHTTKCFTTLTGDVNPANDSLMDSVMVRVRDVGVTQIIAPSGTVDSGTVVTPQAKVKNYGNRIESFPVTFRIGTFYTNTQNVINLNPGDSTVVTFATCTLRLRGTHTTKCTTALTGDVNPANNALTSSVTVRVLDVGVSAILIPTGIIDSGVTVTPRVKVKNFGTTLASFPVWFRIHSTDNLPADKIGLLSDAATFGLQVSEGTKLDQIYEDSIWLELPPGDSAIRDFRPWTATIPDTYRLESFTVLSGDMNRRNDTAYGSVIVRRPVHDVGVIRILAPIGEIDSGTVVIPKAIVQNFGTTSENFPVRFKIGTFYTDDTIITLAAGRIDTVEFIAWIASPIGVHITKCTTLLTGDINPLNDFVSDSVRVVPLSEITESYLIPPIPKVFVLEDNFPNPFISKTLIRYALPKDCWVNLQVYNSSGILVRKLKTGKEKAGFYKVIWNGYDEKGKKVPNGVYFCRLEADEFIATKKMVKME